MTGTRYSRQREAILSYLKSTRCHPTAEIVYDAVKKVYPNISLGTVYRNLNQLASQGCINALTLEDGSVHYDGNTYEHHHFLCRRCGCVQDIMGLDCMEDLNQKAMENFTGQVEGHFIYFYGICEKCIGNNCSVEKVKD